MMHRKGKNAILRVIIGLKYRIYSFLKAAVRAKNMAACEIRFCGFLTFLPFEINFDRRKHLCVFTVSKKKIKTSI